MAVPDIFTYKQQKAMKEHVVLVNERDEQVGTAEKVQAHVEGKLHRAFSIFVFNSAGKLLLQQRSLSKYHTPGQWSNTCCSHPRPGESVLTAARRRLPEEMGFQCDLKPAFCFVYKSRLGELHEHEYDHVLLGSFDGAPSPNEAEVASWRWINPDALRGDVARHPEKYTPWFRLSYERVLEHVGGS